MNSTSKGIIIVAALATIGLWGCGQNKNEGAAKLRELESRHLKLEEDYQAVVKANEEFRKRLGVVEGQRAELAKKVESLQAVVRERNELRQQVQARTSERDAFHAQIVQFAREVQNLANRIEAATNSSSSSGHRPVTAALVN